MSSGFEQQNIRTTQLIQNYHPVLRRRAYTSIRTSFPGFFSTQNQHKSHHQPLLVESMSECQKSISENFSRINRIIDVVDQHIRKRIECYENQVVNVVQKEIEQMRQQTEKVVAQFNTMILEKNKQQQIWSLNNQLDYFKSQAKKLYDSNKHLKSQNLQLSKKNQQYEWELQNRQVVMQKLFYKYQKERHAKNKLKLKIHIQSSIAQQINTDDLHSPKYQNQISNSKPSIIQGFYQSPTSFNTIKDINKQTLTKSFNKLQLFTINKNNNVTDNFLHQNSLLQIDYEEDDQQQQLGEIFSQKTKMQRKTELKDQESQANIYLSEHWYKALFEKERPTSKKGNKKSINIEIMSKQTWTQTDSPVLKLNIVGNNEYKRKGQKQQKSSQKAKCLDLIKNGFSILQPQRQRKHNRTQSYYTNSRGKGELCAGGVFNERQKIKKQRMNTEMNFHCSKQDQFEFELLTPKQSAPNSNNKFIYKMANKFQRNKIAQRAYDKNNIPRVESKK